MRWIAWPLLIAAGGYIALLMLLYAGQRKLQYVPDPVRRPPAAVGLPQADERILETTDGERVIVWHVPPRADMPVVIYFQGNGGGLDLRAKRFRRLIAEGIGLVALNYRGYGGSSGSPTEAGLIADANAAYGFAVEHYPVERLVLWGESLGTASPPRSRPSGRSRGCCWNRRSPRSRTWRRTSFGICRSGFSCRTPSVRTCASEAVRASAQGGAQRPRRARRVGTGAPVRDGAGAQLKAR
jgi:hypothetical protein